MVFDVPRPQCYAGEKFSPSDLFGAPLGGGGGFMGFFSARLDETGTDGRSSFVIVAGGVSTVSDWNGLEAAWARLLDRSGVSAFHSKEFNERSGEFEGWSNLKCSRFTTAQEKILSRNVLFEIAVAVERKTHAAVKKAMHGTRGFKPDSDYGMCFRVLRYLVCEKLHSIDARAQVQFIVEQGPRAADAAVIYEQIRRMTGANYRPAKYAEMLAGFAHAPKGALKSLEAADYIAGRSLADLEAGRFIGSNRPRYMCALLHEDFLCRWHEDMLKEKEHRRAHALAKRGTAKS